MTITRRKAVWKDAESAERIFPDLGIVFFRRLILFKGEFNRPWANDYLKIQVAESPKLCSYFSSGDRLGYLRQVLEGAFPSSPLTQKYKVYENDKRPSGAFLMRSLLTFPDELHKHIYSKLRSENLKSKILFFQDPLNPMRLHLHIHEDERDRVAEILGEFLNNKLKTYDLRPESTLRLEDPQGIYPQENIGKFPQSYS